MLEKIWNLGTEEYRIILTTVYLFKTVQCHTLGQQK